MGFAIDLTRGGGVALTPLKGGVVRAGTRQLGSAHAPRSPEPVQGHRARAERAVARGGRPEGTLFTDRRFEHVPALAGVADLLSELLATAA